MDFIQWVSLPPRKYEQGVRATLHKAYKPLAEYVLAMMQVTQVFSVRLAILTLAMPIFLPFATLFALTVAVTASTFKKYLYKVSGNFTLFPLPACLPA